MDDEEVKSIIRMNQKNVQNCLNEVETLKLEKNRLNHVFERAMKNIQKLQAENLKNSKKLKECEENTLEVKAELEEITTIKAPSQEEVDGILNALQVDSAMSSEDNELFDELSEALKSILAKE